MGADDYLTKLFSPRELLARIRAVLRRATVFVPGDLSGTGQIYQFAGWRLDAARRQLYSPTGALVVLRTAEFDILLAFVERPQRVLTRDQLLDLARGRAASPFDRAIDVHISRLRRRIEADPKEPEMIRTVRSGGYYFAATVSVGAAVT
jgi:two-component system OmpR family response regulator